MFFLKYGFFALTLVIWFAGSSYSIELEVEGMQGDREKRTLILGVLFKKLLLQQALARNNMRMNSTTMMPPQEMMGDPGSSNGMASEGPPSPPTSSPQPAQPAQPAPPPQPAQNSPAPESTPQEPPPVISMPQGIRNPQAVSQGPPPTQGFQQQQQSPNLGPQRFPSLNIFNPSQQPLLFPPNYPFGVQTFRQLPFGPAPALGAQAGPQRFSNFFPLNFQNGYFQSIPQQASFLQPTGSSGSPSQTAAQTSPQQTSSAIEPPQEQIPPSGVSSSEQPPSPAAGPEGPSQTTQSIPSPQESAPEQSPAGQSGPELQNPAASEGETAQALPPNSSPPEPQLSPQLPSGTGGAQQNFQFGAGPSGLPPSQATGGEGSIPNFSFDQQQGTIPSNGQEPPAGQQGLSTNFSPPQPLDTNLQQQFDNQLQQQLSTNGLAADRSSIPQNFVSPNVSPSAQPGQPDGSFFDFRQFAGADNSVFDFPQEGGTPSNGNSEQQQQQQQQTQPDSLQNGIFAPTGQDQFSSSVNDPRSNFAFRGQQQFDFSSPFQDSDNNFQRNFFQQNLF